MTFGRRCCVMLAGCHEACQPPSLRKGTPSWFLGVGREGGREAGAFSLELTAVFCAIFFLFLVHPTFFSKIRKSFLSSCRGVGRRKARKGQEGQEGQNDGDPCPDFSLHIFIFKRWWRPWALSTGRACRHSSPLLWEEPLSFKRQPLLFALASFFAAAQMPWT